MKKNILIRKMCIRDRPSPFILTVSNPMCIRISSSLSVVKPIACCVGKTIATVPLTGAVHFPSAGITAMPSPTPPLAKVLSSTWLKAINSPSTGAATAVGSDWIFKTAFFSA